MDRAQRLIFNLFPILFYFVVFPSFSSTCPAPAWAPPSDSTYLDEGLAYKACLSIGAQGNGKNIGGYVREFTGCIKTYQDRYQPQFKITVKNSGCKPDGYAGYLTVFSTQFFTIKCGDRPPQSWSSRSPDIAAMDGAISCRDGCTALNKTMSLEGDTSGVVTFSADFLNATCDTFPQNCAQYGSGWYFSSVFLACMPPEPQCPDGQSRGTNGKCKEACPAGMVEQANGTCKPKASECPAGQVKAPDGSCIDSGQCPAGQTKGADGTCKPEKPPEEDGPDNCPAGQKADANGKCQYDESFSGGDDCSMPPTCSGSPILCGQARIQWRIDCNTRKNTNVSGGTCASVPLCTGEKCDAVEYAQLIQQWKTACALEKLAAGGATDPGDTSGQPDWTKVTGMSQDPGAGASGDDTKVLTDKSLSPNDLDQGGFGGGSCMGFVSGSVGGDLANGFAADLLNPPAFWCDYVAAIKAVMILLGAVAASYILSRPT